MTVHHLVDRERRRLRVAYSATGLALVAAASCGITSFGVLALGRARWMELPRFIPFIIWASVLVADAAIGRWTWTRVRDAGGRHRIAADIEREQSLRAGSLRGVLEIGDATAFGHHASNRMATRLEAAGSGASLVPRAQGRARRIAGQGLAAALIAALLLGWIAPVFDDGLMALLLPIRAWRGTLFPKIEFRGLPPQLVRGERLAFSVYAPRRSVVRLTQRTTGEGWKTVDLRVSPASGVARAVVGPLAGDLLLVASDGRASSDTAVVRVSDRPFVGAVSIRAIYPPYLGRAPEGMPVGEPARVPQGTRIQIAGRASTQLRVVELHNDKSAVRLRADGHAFAGELEAGQSGRWNWVAFGRAGPISDVPLPLELEVIADSAPRIDIVSPRGDTIVAGDDRVALQLTASDDHGLSAIDLQSWRQPGTGERQPLIVQRLASGQSTVWTGIADIDLAPRDLEPGDVLHIKAMATDNSPWHQHGESRELLLKIPTMQERRALARAAADSTVRSAASTAAAERSLEQRTGEVARERERSTSQSGGSTTAAGNKDQAMSYESAERSRAVAKDQQAMLDKIKALQQQAAQLADQLRQAGAMDSSLARQLREAQALLQQALTPELLAQMQKLEDATHQLSGDQARQALKDLAAMQQRLREQLEKSAEMLKRAAYEGTMQTLHDEATDIADRDHNLADSAASMPPEQQRARAEQLADRSERLSNDMQQLQQRLAKDKAEPGAQLTEQARRYAAASEEQIRAAAAARSSTRHDNAQEQQTRENGRNGGSQRQPSDSQRADASANAERAASQMQQAAQVMKDARDAQVQAWKKELTGELDRAVQELLQMARQESAIEQTARSGQGKPEEMRGQQSAVTEGVQQTAQQLQQEGQKTSLLSSRSQRAMNDAAQKVAQANQALAEQRGASQSANSLGEAADALNRAAASLARDREKAGTASSASGFAEMLQQLQEMAKKQGGINAQAQGLIPMLGGGLSSAMQMTARALGKQQRQIAHQLDDLGESAGGDRAAQMAKEARQLADALEGGRVDATTLARQQQLFRRLLDAGRSLEKDERDENGKREAKAAIGAQVFTPDNTNAEGKSAIKFREPTWNELRGLTSEERRAILDYFKRINAQP